MTETARGRDTRAKMLEVAGRHFAAKGYQGAHLEHIAREVGVRKTALYYYFESKEVLYHSVLEEMLADFERVLAASWDDTLSRAESLRVGASALNDVLAANPTFAQILVRIFVDRDPIDAARLRPYLERLIAGGLRFFDEGVAEGVFRPLSGAHVFMSALGMATFYYASGDVSARVLGVDSIHSDRSAAERREQFVEMLLRGVLAGQSA